jgi:hypothetical protein
VHWLNPARALSVDAADSMSASLGGVIAEETPHHTETCRCMALAATPAPWAKDDEVIIQTTGMGPTGTTMIAQKQ